jgi:hypothetical protein
MAAQNECPNARPATILRHLAQIPREAFTFSTQALVSPAAPHGYSSTDRARRSVMAFDWSIIIEGEGGAPAQFVPQGGNPGDDLQVKENDTVTWGNNTSEPHLPWPTDSQHNLIPLPFDPKLSQPIQPDGSSNTWVVVGQPGTIHYRCATHPHAEEFGTITITAA